MYIIADDVVVTVCCCIAIVIAVAVVVADHCCVDSLFRHFGNLGSNVPVRRSRVCTEHYEKGAPDGLLIVMILVVIRGSKL